MYLSTSRTPYGPRDRDLIRQAHVLRVQDLLAACPVHRSTPLLALPAVAAEIGLADVYIKAEWARMGLLSFKALGGAYAIAELAVREAEKNYGRILLPEELQSMATRTFAQGMTVVCASAGNHGLAVAAGAKVFGAQAVVYLSESVPETFASRLRAKGAIVKRAGATYEESMAHATAKAIRHDWALVSDSSWPGYTKTPLDVMRGYTVLFEEAAQEVEATGGPATHVFVQAGVGGLAAAAVSYLRDRWGEEFKFIVVEPEGAACILESAVAGRCVRITGSPTTLGRLDCKEPSLLAYELLHRLTDAFMVITDAEAADAASRLGTQGAPVSACGAAGAAGLIRLCGDSLERRILNLGASSRVLVIGTEASEEFAEQSQQNGAFPSSLPQ